MLQLPGFITLTFILTTLLAYLLFVLSFANSTHLKVRNRANSVAIMLLLWLIFQSTLSLNGWYMDRLSVPPHLAFPLAISMFFILFAFITKLGRNIVDVLSIRLLIWLHIVRIPVELCLYWLSLNKQVPVAMTFNGYNPDILFGISAIVIALIYQRKPFRNSLVFLVWNVLGLASVLSVMIRGIGATPTAIQAWDFSQPNFAVMHFPFIWLPAFIVPVVIFSHLAAIRSWKLAH